MSTATPGDWSLHEYRKNSGPNPIVPTDGRPPWTHHEITIGAGNVIVGFAVGSDAVQGFPSAKLSEVVANARLMIGAPKLLEACEAAEHWLTEDLFNPGDVMRCELLRVLRAAIEEAKGGS